MSLFGKPEHRQCDCAKLAVVKPSLTRADGKERKSTYEYAVYILRLPIASCDGQSNITITARLASAGVGHDYGVLLFLASFLNTPTIERSAPDLYSSPCR